MLALTGVLISKNNNSEGVPTNEESRTQKDSRNEAGL
jgi:hypothetical protein